MQSAFDLVHALTDQATPTRQRRGLAEEFAHTFGWRPNDFLETQSTLATASLVVEHGLDNAAVLSFLPSDRSLRDIQVDERRSILGLSYNSLVDWHVWIDRNSIEYVYNRTNPPTALPAREFDQSDYSPLTKLVFDQATDRVPNPNVPALDAALMDTIYQWRRILRSEIGPSATNASMSSLFNAIIFARAIEDFRSRVPAEIPHSSLRDHVRDQNISITGALARALAQPAGSPVTRDLFDPALLEPFEQLPASSTAMLIEAFYRHRAVPYDYDFSVISKHALSKIYERYVSVMQHDESVQFSFFPSPPSESWDKRLGGIYTPQYIASFFTRYLQQEMTPERFIGSAIADPACGSGIFLRAAMEQKLLSGDQLFAERADLVLQSLFGVDVDSNAVAASRLSLALLYLAVRGELPDEIPILHDDAIELFAPGSQLEESFDAVMVNPPFIRTELQSEEVRVAIAKHVGFLARGKLDIYLAFVALSIRALKPGGFGLFVVPHPLLTSQELASLRDWIRDQAWIRLLADLSAIRVFDADVYVALLIVQRKDESQLTEPPVSLITCQRGVGAVLEDFLDGRRDRGSSYLMFDAPQAALAHATWSVRTPEETRLLSTLEAMPPLKTIALVSQGVITGGDYAFLIDAAEVPRGEEVLYRPFLPDRMIGQFALPEETGRRVFYPFMDGGIVTAAELEADFPATWARLNRDKARLLERAPVKRGNVEWWQPAWPRHPREMLRPKIVTPEVSLLPRFGLDMSGRWVVSHSPLVRIRMDKGDDEVLFVLTAILNSSVAAWFIASNARKFRDGANKLTVGLLRNVPVPDLSMISSRVLRRVVDMARALAESSQDIDRDLVSALDDIVLRELYRLDDDDIALLNPWAALGDGSAAVS